MARFFNTSGVCRPDDHYMLPAEPRVTGLRRLIDEKLYFVVHAPRQVGKSTSLRALAESLTAEGRYTALLTSCEVGQLIHPDLEASMSAILDILRQRADYFLPPELRPPPVDGSLGPGSRLHDLLKRWCETSPRPIVLFPLKRCQTPMQACGYGRGQGQSPPSTRVPRGHPSPEPPSAGGARGLDLDDDRRRRREAVEVAQKRGRAFDLERQRPRRRLRYPSPCQNSPRQGGILPPWRGQS